MHIEQTKKAVRVKLIFYLIKLDVLYSLDCTTLTNA